MWRKLMKWNAIYKQTLVNGSENIKIILSNQFWLLIIIFLSYLIIPPTLIIRNLIITTHFSIIPATLVFFWLFLLSCLPLIFYHTTNFCLLPIISLIMSPTHSCFPLIFLSYYQLLSSSSSYSYHVSHSLFYHKKNPKALASYFSLARLPFTLFIITLGLS